MSYRLSRVDWVLLPVAIGIGAGLVYAAVGLVAVNVDLERGGPIGEARANLFAAFAANTDRMNRAEKAEQRAAVARDQGPIFVAKVVSAGMVILGFGLFFLVQWPG